MSLSSAVNDLADRIADEFNTLRGSIATSLSGKAATSHSHAAGDVISATFAIARIPTGTTSTTVPLGNDARFTDSRAPNGSAGGQLGGTYPNPTLNYGTSGTTACIGNDSRLSDARTPTAHKTSHATAGGDPIAPADIGAQASSSKLTDIAALTATSGNVVTGNGTTWVSSAPANPAFSTKVETIADSASLTGNSASGATQVGVCAALTQAAAVNPPSNGTVGAPYRYVITASGGTRVVTPTGFVANTDDGDGVAISVASGKTVSIFTEYIGSAGWLYGGYKLQA